jgi:hypothetical protein
MDAKDLRDFTYGDFCRWSRAFILDVDGRPEEVKPIRSTSLGNGDHCILFFRTSGYQEQANTSEGRLKTDGQKRVQTPTG